MEIDKEINLSNVKDRAVRGVAILTGRTALLNLISFIAQGLLWLFITPAEFGVFLLVSATINFLSYFADIGLGAALIQKQEIPDNDDYKTVFSVQEMLVLLIVVIVFSISPYLVKTHTLSYDGKILLYALNISFFLASLKNIPSIMLERKLEFGKFVVPQVIENLVYNVFLVFFAWKGFGIRSFTYAVLARGIFGVIAIYYVQPWRPMFGISRKSVTSLLKFGIPYQLNNFLATLKDDGMTIVLGGILGPFGLGILGTAQKLAQYPLRFFMDNVNKVTFPAFSRMQDDKGELAKSLSRSVFFISALVFPSLVGLIILFPWLIVIIPKYQKWEPAYIPLILMASNSIWACVTTQLTNFFNAIGKIKTTFKFMVMWTILTWVFVPLFSKLWGLNGSGLAYALIGCTSVFVIYTSRRMLKWPLSHSVMIPLVSSSVMGLGMIVYKVIVEVSIVNFISAIIIGCLIYLGTIYLFAGKSAVNDAKNIFKNIINR